MASETGPGGHGQRSDMRPASGGSSGGGTGAVRRGTSGEKGGRANVHAGLSAFRRHEPPPDLSWLLAPVCPSPSTAVRWTMAPSPEKQAGKLLGLLAEGEPTVLMPYKKVAISVSVLFVQVNSSNDTACLSCLSPNCVTSTASSSCGAQHSLATHSSVVFPFLMYTARDASTLLSALYILPC